MMTIDSRVDRKAAPTQYLAGPVLLNQVRWSFDCDRLDVTWPGFESHVGPKIKKFSQLGRPATAAVTPTRQLEWFCAKTRPINWETQNGIVLPMPSA